MESQKQIFIFVVITCIALISPVAISMALFTIYKRKILEKETKIKEIEHQKQIESFKIVADAEEREREKIAKNLHDSIIPSLTAIKRSLEMNSEANLNVIKSREHTLKDIEKLSHTITEIRGVSHDLVPPTLAMYGLIQALAEHVEYIGEAGKTKINFDDRTNFAANPPFSMPEQHNIYRICLELMQNLHKYANYRCLNIIAESVNNNLTFQFIHDGKGISNAEIETLTNLSKGLGLKSLKSRTLILNASIDYSYDNETACIVVNIPIKHEVKSSH